MTSSKQPKRFQGFDFKNIESGTWSGALVDPAYLAALGEVAASYEHLELAMPQVLSILLGTGDSLAAGYVYRSIRNPKTRNDLMRHLLEVAPHNKHLPEWFDNVLRSHDSIRARRNRFIHGLWTHKHEDDSTFLAAFPEHGGWAPGEARRVPLGELTALVSEATELTRRIHLEIGPLLAQLIEQQRAKAIRDADLAAERKRKREAKLAGAPKSEALREQD